MKTEIKTRIRCETDTVHFGYYDVEQDEWVDLQSDVAALGRAAKQLNCSTELLDTLVNNFDFLRDQLTEDLRCIWMRLDEMEKLMGELMNPRA